MSCACTHTQTPYTHTQASMSSRGVQPSSSSVRGSRSNHSSHHSNLMADLLRSLIAPHRLRPSSSHMRPHHQTYNSSSWGSMHSRALHVSRGVMQEDTVYGSDVPIGVEAGMTDAQTRELIVSQVRFAFCCIACNCVACFGSSKSNSKSSRVRSITIFSAGSKQVDQRTHMLFVCCAHMQFRSSQGVGQIKDLLVRFDWCCDEW